MPIAGGDKPDNRLKYNSFRNSQKPLCFYCDTTNVINQVFMSTSQHIIYILSNDTVIHFSSDNTDSIYFLNIMDTTECFSVFKRVFITKISQFYLFH